MFSCLDCKWSGVAFNSSVIEKKGLEYTKVIKIEHVYDNCKL